MRTTTKTPRHQGGDNGFAQRPILTHPNLRALLERYQGRAINGNVNWSNPWCLGALAVKKS